MKSGFRRRCFAAPESQAQKNNQCQNFPVQKLSPFQAYDQKRLVGVFFRSKCTNFSFRWLIPTPTNPRRIAASTIISALSPEQEISIARPSICEELGWPPTDLFQAGQRYPLEIEIGKLTSSLNFWSRETISS